MESTSVSLLQESLLAEQERLLRDLSHREPELAAALQHTARQLTNIREFFDEERQRFLRGALMSVAGGGMTVCLERSRLPRPLDNPWQGSEADSTVLSVGPLSFLPATMRNVRQQALAVAEQVGISLERRHDLVTAVGEATMNVVRHGAADSGTARVLGSARDRKVQVWIEDKGLMVESPCGGRRQMEDDYFGGYSGMGMMLATCDHVYLYTGTDGTTVVLEVEDPPLAPSAETG